MKVTFIKKGARRYAVEVGRDRYPDLWCGSIGYDDRLPHDLMHFVAESEYGLDPEILKLDDLAAEWQALQVGKSLTLEWPRPEGRRRHPPRKRRRPATARRG